MKKLTSSLPSTQVRTVLFASTILFLLPALAMTTSFGMTLVQLLILVTCIWIARREMSTFYRNNARALAWILIGFGGYFVVNLLRMIWFDTRLALLDGPSRVLFALSCIGFVAVLKPRVRYFWLGLCIGAIGAGMVALSQRLHVDLHTGFSLNAERATGFTHHAITFGDLSLATGLMALCAMSEFRSTRLKFLPLVAVSFGIIASVLSGSRGGWLALVLAVVPLLRYGRKAYGKAVVPAVLFLLTIMLAGYFIPATGIAARIWEASSDLRLYFINGDATTSVGVRLELWKASVFMFLDHPFLGVGRDQFFPALQLLHAQGKIGLILDPTVNSSSHNDSLYFLATGGLLDFSFFGLMYGAPFMFFVSRLNVPDSSHQPVALAGVLLVLCFFDFGLTDTMFWLMIPKVFYAMMVCALIGFCFTETSANADHLQRERLPHPL